MCVDVIVEKTQILAGIFQVFEEMCNYTLKSGYQTSQKRKMFVIFP